MAKTQRQLIEDLEDELRDIKTTINYEAIKPIKTMEKTLAELKKSCETYPLYKDKVDNMWKGAIWVLTLIMGAILLALINGVLK